MTRSRILITGFGPFPGVPENVSGRLAERLAERAALTHRGHPIHAELLPTEWEAVSARAPLLLDALTPRLVLHFGVALRSRGFRIERSAHNIVHDREDACGAFPACSEVLAGGDPRIDTALPAAKLAKHLRSKGLAANVSRSAGTYLCNYLYYLSLDWAARPQALCDVCFVHVPPAEHVPEPELLRGVELILAFLVDRIEMDATSSLEGERGSPTATLLAPLPDPTPQRGMGTDAPSAKP